MKYEEMIKQISPSDLRRSLYYSQALFFCIAVVSSVTLFGNKINWQQLFVWNGKDILLYGFIVALLVVAVELILYRFVNEKHFDDGGINEKIFKNLSIRHVFFIALIVAVAEELLFRGVIQTVFGYIIASSTFALLHYRYLKKILLFSLLVGISFLLGYLFLITNNLLVTIVFHFTVDFLLGLYIVYRK